MKNSPLLLTVIITSSNLLQSGLGANSRKLWVNWLNKQNNKKVTKLTCCRGDFHSDGEVAGEAVAVVFWRMQGLFVNLNTLSVGWIYN